MLVLLKIPSTRLNLRRHQVTRADVDHGQPAAHRGRERQPRPGFGCCPLYLLKIQRKRRLVGQHHVHAEAERCQNGVKRRLRIPQVDRRGLQEGVGVDL